MYFGCLVFELPCIHNKAVTSGLLYLFYTCPELWITLMYEIYA